MKHKHKRRKIDPGLYNSNRLKEKPFPATRTKQNTVKGKSSLQGPMQPKQKKHQQKTSLPSNVAILTLDTPPNSLMQDIAEEETNSDADIEIYVNQALPLNGFS